MRCDERKGNHHNDDKDRSRLQFLMQPFRKNTQRRFLVLLLICGTLMLLVHRVLELNSDAWTLGNEDDFHDRFGLILDTQGCRIPKLDPYDKTVKNLIVESGPHVCKGPPVFLLARPNATLAVNETVLSDYYNETTSGLSCHYRAVHREHEPKGKHREVTISYGEKKSLQFGVPLGEEFLKVDCRAGGKNLTQYIGLVPIKPEVERTKRTVAARKPLNVVLIGIDSVSKLNFLRHFKRTHRFLRSQVAAFDMKGYTKVGDNTFPNLTPLLTGHFVEHYWNETVRSTYFFDDLDFIWKDYSARGYRTMYAEDGVYFGTYQYLKRGFRDPPTDYYFRPLAIAITDSDLKKKGRDTCLNNQLETEVFYEYLKSYVETMGDRPSFSFTMVSSLTHDYLNTASRADEPTHRLLDSLNRLGVMNNSLVVVFSDHGIRFGDIRKTYIGKFEERMPFMYLMLPRWFLDENPSIARNVKQNQNRLITLFDVHATLHHLLELSDQPDAGRTDTTHLGQSLMSEISERRTCETAHILPHWCPCQIYQYVVPSDPMVKKVADAVIDEINMMLVPMGDKCARLDMDEIVDARVGQANNLVQRFVKQNNDAVIKTVHYGEKPKSIADYLVTLIARPGGGMFEATVRHNSDTNTMAVLGISRINKYGTQSDCINSQVLKKFCFCS